MANAVKAAGRAPPCRRGLRRQGLAGLAALPAGRAMKAKEAQEAAVLVAGVAAQANPIP